MYSNDIQQIKSGFVAYIGASLSAIQKLESLPENSRYPAYAVSAMLMEQIINISRRDTKKPIDSYTFRPVLLATKQFFKEQMYIISKNNPVTEDDKNKIIEYQSLVMTMDNLLNSIKSK